MINTIHYQGRQIIKEKDGKEKTVPLHNRVALQARGPLIRIRIGHPKAIIEKLKQEGKEIQYCEIDALIDTGASTCVISEGVAQRIGLIQTGYRKIRSVQDEQDRPSYFASIQFHWGGYKEVQVASCPLSGIDCLIGRDILQHWNMIYNGADGFVIIGD